jgi:hypothetical protein
MITSTKSFPKIQIIFLIVLLWFCSCGNESGSIIADQKFIEIYARLLIIYEMDIDKTARDLQINALLKKYQVTIEQIDSTVSYLNKNPEEWVNILGQLRTRIQEIRQEFTSGDEKKGIEPDHVLTDTLRSSIPKLKKQDDLKRRKTKPANRLRNKRLDKQRDIDQ